MPSTVISGMSHDAEKNTLRVEFVSGLIYEYLDVPEEIFIAMKTSGAKGIYLNKHIKGKYSFKKIENHASQDSTKEDSKEKA
jgi:hypothetical protein